MFEKWDASGRTIWRSLRISFIGGFFVNKVTKEFSSLLGCYAVKTGI
jgi:hypothetical protein